MGSKGNQIPEGVWAKAGVIVSVVGVIATIIGLWHQFMVQPIPRGITNPSNSISYPRQEKVTSRPSTPKLPSSKPTSRPSKVKDDTEPSLTSRATGGIDLENSMKYDSSGVNSKFFYRDFEKFIADKRNQTRRQISEGDGNLSENFLTSAKSPDVNELPNGITLGLHSKDLTYDYGQMVQEIEATGAKWICLQIILLQENANSKDFITSLTDTSYWAQIEKTIQQCQENDLKVMLNPIVTFNDLAMEAWRGNILPKDIDSWFKNYSDLLEKIAIISNHYNIAAIGIGSELGSIERHTRNWNMLIEVVRQNFSGLVTYSSNWDNLNQIDFHHSLDFIGVSGYFSISNDNDPDLRQLTDNWEGVKKYILAYQEDVFRKPIVFTELGYTSQDGTSTNPWNYYISEKVDLIEQSLCFEAFCNVWNGEERFGGVLFYDWFGKGGIEDKGYTVKGKPALEMIELWFSNNKILPTT